MIFDDAWISRARKFNQESWVADVLDQLSTNGEAYLSTLRAQFDAFPCSDKEKRWLKNRLQSFQNPDHLGAVNELTFWQFIRDQNIECSPVPTSSTSRPDFIIKDPVEIYAEITTLNLSKDERDSINNGTCYKLNNTATIKRIINKLTDKKIAQLKYATEQNIPCVLVIFDYTIWSGLGAQTSRVIGSIWDDNFCEPLPKELSAIMYLDRHTINGKISIIINNSAIYHNRLARCKLDRNLFGEIKEYPE